MTDARDIVERLRKVESSAPDSIVMSTCWYRNPDGPEAADTIASLRKQLEDARGSLYQCYRSSRDDALESHPDWAEHIADINRESGEAIARIDEALKGKS